MDIFDKNDTIYNLLKKEYKYENNNNIYTDNNITSTEQTNNYESICMTDKLEDLLEQSKNGYVEMSKEDAKKLLCSINDLLGYLEPIIDSMCDKC